MVSIPSSFVMSTALSVALHGAMVVGWLSMSHTMPPTGKSIELQLIMAEGNSAKAEVYMKKVARHSTIQGAHDSDNNQNIKAEHANSSVLVSEHAVTAVLLSKQAKTLDDSMTDNKLARKKLASKPFPKSMPDNVKENITDTVEVEDKITVRKQKNVKTLDVSNKTTQSLQHESFSGESLSSASTKQYDQQHSMLQLLHASISDNKEYPYIAQRQRREGVAKVGFVLNPDGSIDNARLLTSSRASVLDRAALSAVRAIAPFKPAKHYLEQAETFEIDVVFKLL